MIDKVKCILVSIVFSFVISGILFIGVSLRFSEKYSLYKINPNNVETYQYVGYVFVVSMFIIVFSIIVSAFRQNKWKIKGAL